MELNLIKNRFAYITILKMEIMFKLRTSNAINIHSLITIILYYSSSKQRFGGCPFLFSNGSLAYPGFQTKQHKNYTVCNILKS
jgi:hypothetical protein